MRYLPSAMLIVAGLVHLPPLIGAARPRRFRNEGWNEIEPWPRLQREMATMQYYMRSIPGDATISARMLGSR